jgi:tetratricopeptide (TPR) repeat protein
VTGEPLCFVIMPFGVKPDGRSGSVDFDAVYESLVAPAIRDAELDPLRGDPELSGGLIHKPVCERLVLADYAIADLTIADASVFYVLGVRHAFRPRSTVLVSAGVKRIPSEVAPGRVLSYSLDGGGRPADRDADRAAMARALTAARKAAAANPVNQLIGEVPVPDIDRLKTDVFRDQASYSVAAKERLAAARAKGAEAVRQVAQTLGRLENLEAGVLVDLLLSYRATGAWDDMIRLVEAMPEPVRRTRLVREQYGFALNRAGRSQDAERELQAVLGDHGPSSETFALLGRVHKDRWEAERGDSMLTAQGHLDKAIEAYRRGFEADWRDAYPGVNAVTLMEIRNPGGGEQRSLVPVVRYANRRRIEGGAPDYWDHATRLELGVVDRDHDEAIAGATAALAAVRETWEPDSTAYNLSLIRRSRSERGERIDWADDIERKLLKAAGKG